jgi:hypothetical protein
MIRLQKLSSFGLVKPCSWLHRLHQSRVLRLPDGRLCVLRVIRLLKTSLARLRPNRFFQCVDCRKCVRMFFRHHDTSIIRLHQSRILRRSEGKLWVLRAIRLLKTSFKRLRKSRFYPCQGFRKLFRMVFATLKHRFIDFTKVAFLDVQKADYELSWPFAYLNIT